MIDDSKKNQLLVYLKPSLSLLISQTGSSSSSYCIYYSFSNSTYLTYIKNLKFFNQ